MSQAGNAQARLHSGGGDAEGSLDDHLDVAAQGRLEVHGGVGEAGLDGIQRPTGGAGWLICHRAPARPATMETTCRPCLGVSGWSILAIPSASISTCSSVASTMSQVWLITGSSRGFGRAR